MRRLRHGILASSGGGVVYDTDYQAILDRATTLGYTKPSSSQRALQNTLLVSLKSTGEWSLLDTFYVFANDGSDDFAGINWKSPSSFELTQVNAPTWTSNQGFTGDGASSYLDTGWDIDTNGVNFASPDGSFGIWIRTNATSGPMSYIGNNSGATAQNDIRQGTLKTIASQGNNIATPSAPSFLFMNINTTDNDVFSNGSSIANKAAGTWASNTQDIFLLSRGTGESDGQISIAFTGGDIASKASSFYSSVNTYMTSI